MLAHHVTRPRPPGAWCNMADLELTIAANRLIAVREQLDALSRAPMDQATAALVKQVRRQVDEACHLVLSAAKRRENRPRP